MQKYRSIVRLQGLTLLQNLSLSTMFCHSRVTGTIARYTTARYMCHVRFHSGTHKAQWQKMMQCIKHKGLAGYHIQRFAIVGSESQWPEHNIQGLSTREGNDRVGKAEYSLHTKQCQTQGRTIEKVAPSTRALPKQRLPPPPFTQTGTLGHFISGPT